MKLRSLLGGLFTRDPLAVRFLIAIISFSSMITVAATAIQLKSDYTYMIDNIQSSFSEIEASHLEALSNSVWVVNDRQVVLQLAGILQMSDIVNARIIVNDKEKWSAGEAEKGQLMQASFPLIHAHRGEKIEIGALNVSASLDAVYQRLFNKVFVILLSNGIKTFLVGLLVFVVFQRWISRHLAHMAAHANSFEFGAGHGNNPLVLNRTKKPSARPDILDRLSDAYNEMSQRLSRSYMTLLESEDALAELNKALEAKIVEQQDTAEALRIANETLEDRVSERTHQLEQEVTERRYAEVALKASEERLRDIAEASTDWFWEMGPDMTYRFVSPRGYERTGFTPDDVLGKTRLDMLVPTKGQYHEAWLEHQAAIENKTSFRNLELPITTKDGSELIIRTSGKPIFDEDGTFAGYRGSATDITAFKKAEERLHTFEQMVASAGQGLGIGSADGKVVYVNAALCSLLGADKPEQVIGADYLRFYAKDDADTITEEALPKIFKGEGWGGELTLNGLSGKSTPTIHNMFPIQSSADGEVLVGAAITDISQQAAQAELLKAAKREAEQANHAKSEFLSNMSHELRTPLNAILGFGQIMGMNLEKHLSDGELEYIQLILKSGYHLLKLIDEILDLAKVEAGKLEMSIEPISVQEALDECLPLIKTMAEPRNITINVGQGVKECPPLLADYTRLKQMILNLLSNAVKYNRDDGHVFVDCHPVSDTDTRISVRDTGPGIAKKKQKELFVPFSRLGAENSGIEGTGIGLALTRRIAEMMDGEIGFQSREGEGSTFWINLPSHKAPLAPSAVVGHTKQATGLELELGPKEEKRLLYVEDNPSNLRLMEVLIEKVNDVKLLSAHTAEIGLSVANTERPDMIIIDINLPGMNGLEMIQRLRDNTLFEKTPIIALSADAMKREVEKGLGAGFDQYLTKPLDVAKLMDVLRKYFSGAKEK